jgi:formylmethanofuran dehydrogenase subunit C
LGCASKVGSTDSENSAAVTLSLKEPTTIPIEADTISPDKFLGRNQAEIADLPLFYGRRQLTIGDLFAVKGEDSENIVLEGDLSHIKRVGQAMSRGCITIRGDAGMHLGAEMSGGEIVVHGDVGAWAGAQMSGGRIWIHGNAGPMLGAVYTGEKLGMQGGVIIVDGTAGPRAAERMRRGIIVVQGDLGDFAGARMIAGSVFTFGKLGARPGAGMKRGTLLALQGLSDDLLPTFRYSCTCESPTFLRTYLRRLRSWGLPVTEEHIEGRYRRYTGDATTIDKGEVFIYDQRQ